jgi:hypothetical protein
MGISRSMAQPGAGFSGFGAPRGSFGCGSPYGAFGGDGKFLQQAGQLFQKGAEYLSSDEGQQVLQAGQTFVQGSPEPVSAPTGVSGGMGISIGGQDITQMTQADIEAATGTSGTRGRTMTRPPGTGPTGQSAPSVSKFNDQYGPAVAERGDTAKKVIIMGAAALAAYLIAKQAKLI